MKLPNLPFLDKKPKAEYFLSLLLRDEKANAVIIEESAGKIKIIGKHEEHFTTSVEHVTDEEMLTVLDKVISKAEETLPNNIETEKTVFGVKQSWVEEKKIKKEYLVRLKKVCDSLHLTPIGFLVISEAIAHLIQEEEGAPLSAMLCEVATRSVSLTLFRAGRILETKVAPVEESVTKTVDTLLKHIESVEVLPSRIIIFDGRRSEELGQEFITHQWSKSLPFLHMPQISVLPRGFEAKAVVFGAALQMGFEISGAIIDKTGQEIKTFSSGKSETEMTDILTTQNAAPIAPLASEESENLNASSLTPNTVNATDNESTTTEQSLEDMESDNFGFVKNQDIAAMATSPISSSTTIAETAVSQELRQTTTVAHEKTYEPNTFQANKDYTPKEKFSLSTIISFFASLKQKFHFSGFSFVRFPLGSGNKRLLFIPAVLLGVIFICSLLYIFLLRASVTLHIKTKGLDEKATITFSLTSPNEFSSNQIAAHAVTTSLDGTSSTAVTGKKQVGTNAKGTVTFYNSADGKKTLLAGQVITSSNGQDFILDKDVTIASASGDIFSGTKPGTSQGSVTAKVIGTEANLPSGTKFSVSNNTSVAAKNDSAFSGGTKKDVTVVAKADTDKLLVDVQKDLEEKAKEDLRKKVGADEILLPVDTAVTIDKKSFDKNIGDETKNLTLKATVTFSSASYKKTDLTDYAQVFLKNKFTDDLTISDKGITTELSDVKQKDDDKISANINIKASLLPKINTITMQKKITGKSFTAAEEELKKIAQVESVQIMLHPNLFFLPKLLPQQSSHITVGLATNE